MVEVPVSREPQAPINNRFMFVLDRSCYWSSLVLERIGILGIVVMIVVTIVDVVGAKFFHSPLRAGTELVYFGQVIAVGGALAFTKIAGYHVRMEFIDTFPKRFANLVKAFAALLALGVIVVLAWKSFEYAGALMKNHDVTAAARIPIYPFVYWLAICCIPLCLVLLNELLKAVAEAVKR